VAAPAGAPDDWTFVRYSDLAALFGGRAVVRRALIRGDLRPRLCRPRLVHFAGRDIRRFIRRLRWDN
jgi:hypothetical protein